MNDYKPTERTATRVREGYVVKTRHGYLQKTNGDWIDNSPVKSIQDATIYTRIEASSLVEEWTGSAHRAKEMICRVVELEE